MGANEKVLSVALTMTPDLAGELQRETGQRDMIAAYKITGELEEQRVMAVECNNELRRTKARITHLKDVKAQFVAPAKQIIATAEGFFDPPIEANQALESHLKAELSRFSTEEQKRADDAERQRQAEERAARQKAEQEAAAARAKADEQARELKRQAEEAEAKRVAAEREGNAAAAARAAAASAKLEEQAKAAVQNGEQKALELELGASAAPTTTVVPEATKLEGFSTRENYVAEFEAGMDPDRIVLVLCGAIASGRHDLAALLKFNEPAAHRLAKALKKAMNVPGLKAVNRPIAASRSA